MLDLVVFAQLSTLDAFPAALLGTIRIDPSALRVAAARNSNHHVLFGNQVLYRKVPVERHDRGAAFITVLRRNLSQLFGNNGALPLRLGNNIQVIRDARLQLSVLVQDLLPLQSRQTAQL